MKKLVVSLCLFAILICGLTLPVMAQGNEVEWNTKPTNMYFVDDNKLAIMLVNTPKPVIFQYQEGKGFPVGTQTRIHEVIKADQTKKFQPQYLLPGKSEESDWLTLTWAQIWCDSDGKGKCEEKTEPKPEPKPEPEPEAEPEEKFKCEMPAGGMIIGGIAGIFAPDINAESSAGSAEAQTTVPGAAYGVPIGIAFGAGIDCLIQYIQWQNEQKAKGKNKDRDTQVAKSKK